MVIKNGMRVYETKMYLKYLHIWIVWQICASHRVFTQRNITYSDITFVWSKDLMVLIPYSLTDLSDPTFLFEYIAQNDAWSTAKFSKQV